MIRPQPKPVRAPKRNRKPLKRLRWMVAKPPRRVTRPGPGSDPAYLAKVRKLDCCAPRVWVFTGLTDDEEHGGDVVAHHAGPKSNDSTAVPLCVKHHDQWHNGNGVFKGLGKDARRKWAAERIIETRARIEADSATPAVAL